MSSVIESKDCSDDVHRTAEEKFRSSIEGFLINYIKEEGPKTLDELTRYTTEKLDSLRNPKGGKYKKDVATLMQTALSKKKAFSKNQEGQWTLNGDSAFTYEIEQIRLISENIKERKEKHQSVMDLLSSDTTVNLFEKTVEQDITETLRELDMIFGAEVGGQRQHLTAVIEEHLDSLDDRHEII
ncbi:unnamed protein product [Blepharisma stoltei]|uniref:Uncharacterized protein n=1 Tax=Blepharisma stoltei TaxID=1481888 RepID=A0AAU9IH94_9CILI|nr:unnamed protein product [Blepharisma stoltei]